MKRTIVAIRQSIKSFYMQLPDKLGNIEAELDEIKPAVVKDSKFTKDSGLIVSAFIGLVLGVIFGVMMGVTLYSVKVLVSFTLFVIVHIIIGQFKSFYNKKKNTRKLDFIDTLLYTEIISLVPVLVITVLPAIF